MTETANLGLPFIDGSQAQKHVTHNEALRILDDAIQIAVLDTTLTAPPASPVDGERHVVASGATGAWAGQGNAVATWETDAWRFLAPKAGWCVWSIDDDALLAFDGSVWTPVTTSAATLDNVPSVGINTTVAGSNLLTVRSNDALLKAIDTTDSGTGDVRLQLSKEAAGNTSSVVFSDAFSGRAEFGLTGDDDFHLKVSADGTAWRDALKFDRTTGRVSFPSGGAREVLTADRIYYVDGTSGNDSNDGLASGAGHAFKKVTKALSIIAATLDLAGFKVTVQIADGTYTDPVVLPNVAGFAKAGDLIIQGNDTTPANVVISTTSSDAFNANGISVVWDIKDLTVQTTTSGNAFNVLAGAKLRVGNLNFGACAYAHMSAFGPGSTISILSNYAVSGGASAHVQAYYGAQIAGPGLTITISNSPAFIIAWADMEVLGSCQLHGQTFTNGGTVTGKRFVSTNGSVVFTNGSNPASYFPGNAAGQGTNFATAPYGLYV